MEPMDDSQFEFLVKLSRLFATASAADPLLLNQIIQQVSQFFGSFCAVWTRIEQEKELTQLIAYPLAGDDPLADNLIHGLSFGAGDRQKVMETGQPLWLKKELSGDFAGTISILIFPLLSSNKTIGTLELANFSQLPLAAADHLLLAQITHQIAQIIEIKQLRQQQRKDSAEKKQLQIQLQESQEAYGQLYTESKRQLQELALLDQVWTVLARNIELPALFRAIVELTHQTFGYNLVSIYTVAGEFLILQHQVGYDQFLERIHISQGTSGKVVRTGQPIFIQDSRTEVDFLAAFAGITSEICVPLFDQEQVFGIFNIETTDQASLTEADLRLIIVLSEHINLAITRSRLYSEVRASEEKYRSVVEQVQEVICQINQQGEYLFLNPAWSDMTGFGMEESLGQSWLTFVHPNDRAHNLAVWQTLVHSQTDYVQFECRHLTKGGQFRWTLVHWRVIRTASRELESIAGTLNDITERKEAEAAIYRREALLESVNYAAELFLRTQNWVENIDQVLARFGHATRTSRVYILSANRHTHYPRILEWVAVNIPNSFVTHNIIYHTHWLERLQKGQLLYGSAANFPPTERLMLEAQQIISLAIIPIFVGGVFWGVIGFEDCLREQIWTLAELEILRVVASTLGAAIHREQAENALQESEARFRTLVEHAPEAILLYDLDSQHFVMVNENAIRLFGYEQEELLQLNPIRLSPKQQPKEQRSVTLMKRILQRVWAGELPVFEWACCRADGTLVLCEVRLVRLPGSKNLVRASLTDITVRKQVEEAHQQHQKLESLGLLAGGIAHDFNNLLTGILSQAELALTKLPADNPSSQHISKMVKAAQRASDLTRQLLAYAGKGEFLREIIDLNRFVEDNLPLLQMAVPQSVQLLWHPSGDLPMLYADAGQIQQILMNLVINAIESIEDELGQVIIKTGLEQVEPQAQPALRAYAPLKPGPYICLEIQDNGVGMDTETQKRAFDPFFSTKGIGRGLGLSAILGILRAQGGTIHVISQLGKGSRFQVLMPAFTGIPHTESNNQEYDRVDIQKTVLVIDDEEHVRDAVVDILAIVEIPTLIAANGQEGLELYQSHQSEIGVVLLDLKMPVMSGTDALHALQQINPQVKVILSSGYHETEVSKQFMGLGVTAFLQKPYDLKTLINKVQKVLAIPEG